MKHIPVPKSTHHQFQRLYFSHSGLIVMMTIMLCVFGNAQQVADLQSFNHDADHDHQHQCISPEQSLIIKQKARAAAERAYKTPAFKALVARERAKTATLNHVYFAWPLKAVPAYAHIPFEYTIEFYVDHGTGTSLLDYQCNQRTYNGHHGTDINIWPFFWHMMEQEFVHIVAAAPGMVMTVDDGNNNDQNCSSCPNGTQNNYVSILHADSTISYYMHIKDNSALVEEEDVVEEGTPLAFVGSSGCSFNPHLHFEVHNEDGDLIDPFAGSCNGLNANDTWWQNQKPYWEPRINRLMTHSAEPELHGYDGSNVWCASGESINKKNQFSPGETVWLGAAIYSPQPDDEIDFRLYNPSGTQLLNNIYTYSGNDPAVKEYYAFSYNLSANAPPGTYRFRAFYNNVVYNHWFTVSCTSSYTLSGALPFHHGYISSSLINNSGQTSASGSTAYYQSAGHVRFLPGFHATPGVSLNARIRSCGYSE